MINAKDTLTIIEWAQQQTAFVFFMVVILASIGTFLFIWKILIPKLFPNSVKKDRSETDPRYTADNPHAVCEFSDSAQRNYEDGMNLQQRIDFILNIKRVELQMNEAEIMLEGIIEIMKQKYLDILFKILKSKHGLLDHRDYKDYAMILESLKEPIFRILRRQYKENHIPDDEAAFLSWSNIILQEIQQKITHHLDWWYPDDAIINRITLKQMHSGEIEGISVEGHVGILTYIDMTLIKHFRSVREVSNFQKALVKELQEEQAKISPKGLIKMGI